jgi:hypothetical protein
MLACNQLGNNGRLGNQMFQYAALKGIAYRRGFDYCIPPFDQQGIDNYGLGDAFNIKSFTGVANLPSVGEPHFHYSEEFHNTCPDDVTLVGYFQTEKYFKEIEDQIRKDFVFRDEWLEPCKEFLQEFEEQEIAFLHVRRGDPNLVDRRGFKWAYVNCSDQHPVQPLEYYEEAIKRLPEDMPILVFSDSIEWCKEQEFFQPDRFLFSEPEDKYSDGALVPYVDLCLMSLCDHAIIANSSMSWWGAWLMKNPNKKVIAPKMWFGTAYSQHNTKDIYCDDWEII